MATKIVTKNSSTGGAVPSASDLVQGELAVNVADKRLFTEDNGGSIVELGTKPSTIDINAGSIDGTAIGASSASTGAFTTLTASGEITANGGIALGDNDKATFGASDDLQIYHDGSNSHIKDTATGNLNISGNDIQILNSASNEAMAYFAQDGSVTLYHNGSEKLATTSTGIDVTGTATMDGLTVDTNTLYVDSTNNRVGIGTTTPSATLNLEYSDDTGGNGGLVVKNTSTGTSANFAGLSCQAVNNTVQGFLYSADYNSWGVGTFLGTGTNHPLHFMINNAEKMRIDSSGNVGIGTTAIMEDFGGGRTTLALKGTGTADYSTLQLGNYGTSSNGQIHGLINFYDGTTSVSRIQSVRASNTSDANLVFYTAPSSGGITERMRIDSSGDLNIVNTGQASLNYTTDGSLDYARITGGKSGSGAGDLRFFTYSGGIAERARIDYTGNLMVGKTAVNFTTVGAELRSNGQINSGSTADFLNMFSTSASAYRFYVTNAGTIKATNTTISAISDQRFKENIRDLDDGLSKVMELRPRKFDWKEGKGADIKDDRGFIAQEFEQVFPDLVGEWKDEAPEGEEPYKAVSQDLIPTLVKAIQEQQTLIESLTARIAALEE